MGSSVDVMHEQISSGHTGHYETIRVDRNPDTVDCEALIRVFWNNISPFEANGNS